MSRGTGLGSMGISIKGNASAETTTENNFGEETEIKNSEVVSVQQLIRIWNKMVADIASEKVHLAQTLQSHLPSMSDDGKTINLTVHNSIQEKRIIEDQPEILRYLREKLKNDTLSLSIIVDETVENKKFFTPSEKVQLMIKKNPDLNTLRKMFDLDLE